MESPKYLSSEEYIQAITECIKNQKPEIIDSPAFNHRISEIKESNHNLYSFNSLDEDIKYLLSTNGRILPQFRPSPIDAERSNFSPFMDIHNITAPPSNNKTTEPLPNRHSSDSNVVLNGINPEAPLEKIKVRKVILRGKSNSKPVLNNNRIKLPKIEKGDFTIELQSAVIKSCLRFNRLMAENGIDCCLNGPAKGAMTNDSILQLVELIASFLDDSKFSDLTICPISKNKLSAIIQYGPTRFGYTSDQITDICKLIDSIFSSPPKPKSSRPGSKPRVLNSIQPLDHYPLNAVTNEIGMDLNPDQLSMFIICYALDSCQPSDIWENYFQDLIDKDIFDQIFVNGNPQKKTQSVKKQLDFLNLFIKKRALTERERFNPVPITDEVSRGVRYYSKNKAKKKGTIHPNYHQERKFIDPDYVYKYWDEILSDSYGIALHYTEKAKSQSNENIASLFKINVMNFIRHSADPKFYRHSLIRRNVMTHARNIANNEPVKKGILTPVDPVPSQPQVAETPETPILPDENSILELKGGNRTSYVLPNLSRSISENIDSALSQSAKVTPEQLQTLHNLVNNLQGQLNQLYAENETITRYLYINLHRHKQVRGKGIGYSEKNPSDNGYDLYPDINETHTPPIAEGRFLAEITRVDHNVKKRYCKLIGDKHSPLPSSQITETQQQLSTVAVTMVEAYLNLNPLTDQVDTFRVDSHKFSIVQSGLDKSLPYAEMEGDQLRVSLLVESDLFTEGGERVNLTFSGNIANQLFTRAKKLASSRNNFLHKKNERLLSFDGSDINCLKSKVSSLNRKAISLPSTKHFPIEIQRDYVSSYLNFNRVLGQHNISFHLANITRAQTTSKSIFETIELLVHLPFNKLSVLDLNPEALMKLEDHLKIYQKNGKYSPQEVTTISRAIYSLFSVPAKTNVSISNSKPIDLTSITPIKWLSKENVIEDLGFNMTPLQRSIFLIRYVMNEHQLMSIWEKYFRSTITHAEFENIFIKGNQQSVSEVLQNEIESFELLLLKMAISEDRHFNSRIDESDNIIHPNANNERKYIDSKFIHDNWDSILTDSYLVSIHYCESAGITSEESIKAITKAAILNFIRQSGSPKVYNYESLLKNVIDHIGTLPKEMPERKE